jgi:hypothetical protein
VRDRLSGSLVHSSMVKLKYFVLVVLPERYVVVYLNNKHTLQLYFNGDRKNKSLSFFKFFFQILIKFRKMKISWIAVVVIAHHNYQSAWISSLENHIETKSPAKMTLSFTSQINQ